MIPVAVVPFTNTCCTASGIGVWRANVPAGNVTLFPFAVVTVRVPSVVIWKFRAYGVRGVESPGVMIAASRAPPIPGGEYVLLKSAMRPCSPDRMTGRHPATRSRGGGKKAKISGRRARRVGVDSGDQPREGDRK